MCPPGKNIARQFFIGVFLKKQCYLMKLTHKIHLFKYQLNWRLIIILFKLASSYFNKKVVLTDLYLKRNLETKRNLF